MLRPYFFKKLKCYKIFQFVFVRVLSRQRFIIQFLFISCRRRLIKDKNKYIVKEFSFFYADLRGGVVVKVAIASKYDKSCSMVWQAPRLTRLVPELSDWVKWAILSYFTI